MSPVTPEGSISGTLTLPTITVASDGGRGSCGGYFSSSGGGSHRGCW